LDDELIGEMKIELDKDLKQTPYIFISSVSELGLNDLKDKLWLLLND
ncbi:MAG: GTPase ObgE, partial [Eudoraea sp.]